MCVLCYDIWGKALPAGPITTEAHAPYLHFKHHLTYLPSLPDSVCLLMGEGGEERRGERHERRAVPLLLGEK